MSESRTRRRRLVLSCYECKRRKLKCSRETPVCSRCISVGHPERCKYDARFGATADMTCVGAASPDDVSTSPVSRVEIESFDDWLLDENFQASPWQPGALGLDATGSQCEAMDHDSSIQPQIVVQQQPHQPDTEGQVRSLAGRFRGPSHPASILAHSQHISSFIKQTLNGHHILGAPQWAVCPPRAESPLATRPDDEKEQQTKSPLPEEKCCRRLAESYFQHFASLYAVFHVPTFWREYQAYWDEAHPHPNQFIAELLAVMSCARCLAVEERVSFEGPSASSRNEAVQWLRWVEAWQSHQAARSITMESLRIRCLLLVSKMLNDIDSKEQYTSSQTLVADAVSSGLHRDWNSLGLTESIYEREVRLKIWSTCVELELAACTELGVPSMVSSLFVDLGPPKGIDDADYGSSTDIEPHDHPDDQLTNGSFAKMMHAVRPLRYEINGIVNDPRRHRSLGSTTLGDLRRKISESLDSVPNWPMSASNTPGRSRAVFHQAVVQLYLHELLLLLHVPCAPAQNTIDLPTVDAEFHHFICARSASAIIKIYKLVVHEGFSPMALAKSSLLRSGLCLCLLQGTPMIHGIRSSPLDSDAQADLVQSALDMMEVHVLSRGTELPSLWLLSVASCYQESWGDADASSARRTRITDNIMALLNKMCLAQKHKTVGVGPSHVCFVRYIAQIRQACETVGQVVCAEAD